MELLVSKGCLPGTCFVNKVLVERSRGHGFRIEAVFSLQLQSRLVEREAPGGPQGLTEALDGDVR